ncbi:hypothetical protein MLD38_014286 [Melastoma candidum]|uniref:Uncharacterized protein n=1 Tax=Melastoma candidum TaxID=119954 RepID=A0ACB9RFE2_9MYRT|nr:hypothetical protein MLD38_014286 [Melastoma candidum]
MRPSNIFLLILQLVIFLSRASSAPLFAEYIGAQFNGVKFSDVPVNANIPFHFILAFTIDYDSSTSPPTPNQRQLQRQGLPQPERSTTVSQFLDYYNTQESNYGSGKELASMSTASGAGWLSPADGFFTACSDLQSQGKLNGIFIWSADDSRVNGFPYEAQAQSLLAGSSKRKTSSPRSSCFMKICMK